MYHFMAVVPNQKKPGEFLNFSANIPKNINIDDLSTNVAWTGEVLLISQTPFNKKNNWKDILSFSGIGSGAAFALLGMMVWILKGK